MGIDIRKLWRKAPEPLRGAPPVRRQKTYSAESGYVYQYFYTGWRATAEGVEYVFEVSADRTHLFPVSVLVEAAAVASWDFEHDRELTPTEQYAVAKLALLQAFDERERPQQMHAEVRVRTADAAAILEKLGLE